MAVRKILTIPHPKLYERCEPVTSYKTLRPLVRDMFDTMYASSGVGLAGNQIGEMKRILVLDLVNAGFIKGVFINPVVLEQSSEMQYGEEGCLSVPGLAADLERPAWVKIEYNNLSGKLQTIEAEMLLARALLHEIDHLDGKVYVDLLEPSLKTQLKSDIELIKKGKQPKNKKQPQYRE